MMPEAAEQAQPSLDQMIRALGAQVSQVAQAQAVQAQTLQQLAQGTQVAAQAATHAARAAQPQAGPDDYAKLNSKYLETLANDPIGLRNAEKQQIQQEVVQALRQEMAQNLSAAEKQRHAEELERQIFQQHPQLMRDGAQMEYYLKYLAADPRATTWSLDQKIATAIDWTYQFQNERREEEIAHHEARKKAAARGSLPGGGGAFRDPGRADADEGPNESPEEANMKRFRVMQERQEAAMNGGRYMK